MDLLNTGLQTTDKQAYILCVDTRERLEIQFIPNSIDINRDADISTIKIINRNTPKYQTTGGETTIKLTLDFYADDENRSSVLLKCNWLQALTYTDKGKKPARRIAIIFGDVFKKEIWTVKSVNPKYDNFSKPHGLKPKQAYVDLTLCLDVDYNMGWEDVNVNYPLGAPDGSNPFRSTQSKQDLEDDQWRYITNDNSFSAIRARALQNLGLTGYYDGNY